MSQRAATIESLPVGFEARMGLEGEDYHPPGGQADSATSDDSRTSFPWTEFSTLMIAHAAIDNSVRNIDRAAS